MQVVPRKVPQPQPQNHAPVPVPVHVAFAVPPPFHTKPQHQPPALSNIGAGILPYFMYNKIVNGQCIGQMMVVALGKAKSGPCTNMYNVSYGQWKPVDGIFPPTAKPDLLKTAVRKLQEDFEYKNGVQIKYTPRIPDFHANNASYWCEEIAPGTRRCPLSPQSKMYDVEYVMVDSILQNAPNGKPGAAFTVDGACVSVSSFAIAAVHKARAKRIF